MYVCTYIYIYNSLTILINFRNLISFDKFFILFEFIFSRLSSKLSGSWMPRVPEVARMIEKNCCVSLASCFQLLFFVFLSVFSFFSFYVFLFLCFLFVEACMVLPRRPQPPSLSLYLSLSLSTYIHIYIYTSLSLSLYIYIIAI